MAKTKNLGLNLTTDEETIFSYWRQTIDGNGVGDRKSNFQIIDDVFGEVKTFSEEILVHILTAESNANTANTNANEAKTTASTASTTANDAKNKSTIAYNTAKDAQTLANEAKNMATDAITYSQEGGGGVRSVTGAILETATQSTLETGLYLCTQSSTNFAKGSIYLYDGEGFFKMTMSTVTKKEDGDTGEDGGTVVVKAEISKFSVSGISGTKEIGATVNLSSYSFTVTKPDAWSKFYIKNGETTLKEITANGSTTYKGEITGKVTASNTHLGTTKLTLVGETNEGNKEKTVSFTSLARQYYGAISDKDLSALPVDGFTYDHVKDMTTVLERYLINSLVLEHNVSEDSYIWFLVPSNMSISYMQSGMFAFPFVYLGETTVTNVYGVTKTYKAYRSEEKIPNCTVEINEIY